MKALIIVDLQNDFVEGGALAVQGGRDLVPIANELQRFFGLIAATQDWHPDDHSSHACNHPGHKPGDVVHLDGYPQVLWPTHCVQDTPGADFVPGLRRDRWAAVFQKGTDPKIDSYSGFFDNRKQQATGLEKYLRDRGVTDIYILGLATDYCVKFTALDALEHGFATHVIIDACRGVELQPRDVEKAVQEMREAGAKIITVESVKQEPALV